MKVLKNILLLLSTHILAIALTFVWKDMYMYFLHSVEYPWGNQAQSYYDPYNWMKLAIHNGVQLIYICALFFQFIYIYSWCCRRMAFSTNHKFWYFTLSCSWTVLCVVSFLLANMTCCPGMYRVIFNPLDWLIYPEFLLFYVLGQIYLAFKIRNKNY